VEACNAMLQESKYSSHANHLANQTWCHAQALTMQQMLLAKAMT